MKSINQTGIRELVFDCLLNPEKYTDRPIIIWQAPYDDGIQYWAVREGIRKFNHGKPKEEWKSSLMIKIPEDDFIGNGPNEKNENPHIGLYVLQPSNTEEGIIDPDMIKRKVELLASNNFRTHSMSSNVPVILFTGCVFFPVEPADNSNVPEQYVFEPHFDEWAADFESSNQNLIDFIRGNGDKADITYRWYNYFNNQDLSNRKGCDFPNCWLEGLSKLRWSRILKFGKLKKYSEIEEDIWNNSFNGISPDLVAEFRKFVIERNL